jgi:PilZ domain
MTQEKRRARRQTLRHTAWLAVGPGELHDCKLSDISAVGARIDVDESVTLPDHFMLFLTNNGATRRACRVVWRNAQQIGVEFEPRLGSAEKTTQTSTPDSAPAPTANVPAESA